MTENNSDTPQTIVLISADTEWRAIKSILPKASIQTSPLGEWFNAIQSDTEIEPSPLHQKSKLIFFHGGWGKIAAAASTQYVIDRWQPGLLINLGTCGGFESHIERGTIVLAVKTIVYDIIEQMGDLDEHIAHYTTDIDLSWLDQDYHQDVLRTLLVSGDRDLMVEDLPELSRRYGAVAGDWESGAIAFVAARNNIRTLILRGVSDLVGGSGGEAYGNLELFEQATDNIMRRLLSSLPGWLKAAQNN